MQQLILSFYENLFGASYAGSAMIDRTCIYEGNTLSEEQRAGLVTEFSERDVWDAVRGIDAEKTP
ncbi:hypothetical protein Dimus_005366, partial [Dionaea muscipula]